MAPFPWAAAAGLGGGVLNSILGAGAANDQASAMRNAAQAGQIASQRGARAALELSAPQYQVGQSALATLAAMYGLPVPDFVDIGSVAAGISPTEADLTLIQGNQYYDPRTGQRYDMAQHGANAGEFVRVPGMYGSPQAPAPGSRNAFAPQGAGSDVLNSLIENNPGIQFVNEQNQRQIAQQNASQGRFLSGAQTRDALDYSTGAAATNYNNMVLNPLFRLAGFGSGASQQGANIIQNNAANQANALANQGAARASGYGARAANYSGLVDDAINYGGQIANWFRNR